MRKMSTAPSPSSITQRHDKNDSQQQATSTHDGDDDDNVSVGAIDNDDDDDIGDNNLQTRAVEAEDVSDEKNPGLLGEILHRMNPTQCMPRCNQCFLSGEDAWGSSSSRVVSSCHNPLFDDMDVEDVAAALLKDLKHEGKSRTVALQKLYRLTDKERKENRMPIVCTTRFNAVGAIIPSIGADASSADRRRALLLLNNLCIPVENKAAILLNPEPLQQLIPALLKLLRQRAPESYLAMVCLYNLSFLQDAKTLLFNFVPVEQCTEGQEAYRQYAPTDNPISLLRTVETAMKEFLPCLVQLQEQQASGNHSSRARSLRVTNSVEWHVIRFAMGMFRNLVTEKENAIVAATETALPSLAIQSLQVSDRDLSMWSRDSLEDASLMLLVHLAKHPDCIESLRRNIWNDATRQVLQSLHGKGGIHETRAMALLRYLEKGDHTTSKRTNTRHSDKPISLVQDEKKDY